MRSTITCAAVLVSFLVSGCGTSIYGALDTRYQDSRNEIVEESVTRLEQAAVCCEHRSDLDYKAINVDEEHSYEIGRSGIAFEFETGKSFFFGAELPENEASVLDMRAFMYGVSTMVHAETAFYPIVELLDESHDLIERHDDARYLVKQEFWSGDRYLWDEFSVPKDARFVLIYTDPSLVGHGFPFEGGSSTTPVGATGAFVPVSGPNLVIPYRLTGTVKVKLQE